MKKAITSTILATIIVLSMLFTACTSESENITVDTSDLSAKVMGKYEFPAMYEVPSDELLAEFAITEEYFSEFSAYTTEEPYGIERIFFGIVNADISAKDASLELESYFQKIKDQSENYDAVEFAKAENAEVFTKGNFIALVICEDSEGALDYVKELIK